MSEVRLEISNYWDDFLQRAEKHIQNLPINLDRLTIHMTLKCNLGCKYCNLVRTSETLDQKVVSRIIREYCSMGGKTIHFTGGEPTVVDYFEDIITEAHDNGLKVSINTNGVKTINDISKISKLKCSFDGFDLDSLYQVSGVSELIHKSFLYYNNMIRNDQVFSMTCVLSKLNYLNIFDIVKHIRKYFPKVYNIYFSIYKGTNPLFLFSDEEVKNLWTDLIPTIKILFAKIGDKYSKKQVDIYEKIDFENGIRFPENNIFPCFLQMSELTIGVDYKIYNCSHLYRDGDPPIKGLDIRKNSLEECFIKAKKAVENKIPLSKNCLTGCNRNLCNFNKYVIEKNDPII